MFSDPCFTYNRDGGVIWEDATVKMAEPGDSKAIILINTTDLTATNFEKLHPSAITMGDETIEVLLTRFDDTIAGNKVSGIQFMK